MDSWKSPMHAAFVTGATRGVGRAIATSLSEAGWRTFALGRDTRVLDEMRAIPNVEPVALDLTDRDALQAVLGDLEIAALIHAAQLSAPAGPFTGLSEAEIDALLEVNLSAAIHLTCRVVRGMVARGRGRVLLLLSGQRGPAAAENAVSAAADAGIRAFADRLDREVAALGVRVEIVEVGMANTRREPGELPRLSAVDVGAVEAVVADVIGRLGAGVIAGRE